MSKTSGVYAIVGTCGKMYIGSSVDVEARWNKHKRSLTDNKHHSVLLQRYVNKYGLSSIELKVIETFSGTRKELYALEQKYIDSLKPQLNSSKSANGPVDVVRSDEYYRRLSEGMYKMWSDPEEKSKRISSMNSKETVKRCSEAAKKTSIDRSKRMQEFNKSFWTADEKAKQSERRKQHLSSEENRNKMSEIAKSAWKDQDFVEKVSKQRKERCSDPLVRKQMSDVQKKVKLMSVDITSGEKVLYDSWADAGKKGFNSGTISAALKQGVVRYNKLWSRYEGNDC